MKVYQAINAVQADLAKSGIGKDRENTYDRYKFRGIDDVYNALAPLLAKHGLCVLPRILKRESVERESQKGGALFYVTVEAEFDFVSAEDGSKHVVRTFGEAMDRGDKATNKAMSAAYKYAAFQAFAIPTEGDNDADAGSPDPKPGALKGALNGPITPTSGAEDLLTPERAAEMQVLVGDYIESWDAGKTMKVIRHFYTLTNDEQVYVTKLLQPRSDIRRDIKANSPHKEAA